MATRSSIGEAWPDPMNLGATVNTTFSAGAPALSSDGTTLYFWSNWQVGKAAASIFT